MGRFYKGRTNNHLTWVMVDATDFATPESALSAATKIKIYGKLRTATGVNFVSSGTGSLTNDIQHVGASATGVYTIALAKADLSDASAAWYDEYTVILSATGAAQQVLVVEGAIDESNLSGVVSDIYSALVALSDAASNAYSAAAQANSRVLVTQSMASDAASAAIQANSRVLLNQSRISDIASYLVVMSGVQSDIYSALSDFQSDFGSRVPKRVATDSQLSDLHSDLRSYLVVMSGVQSDIYSALSDFQSDFGSRVPKRVATDSQLSDLASDIKSAVGAITVVIDASAASDIASAVWAHTVGTRVDSRILVAQSYLSDIRSHVSDLQSDFQSRVPKRVATDSQLSDLASDIKSAVAGITASVSASDISDIASAVYAVLVSDLSDIYSAATQTNSRVLVVQSIASDVRSHVSDLQSDFQSRVPKRVATDSQLSDVHSDLKSAIGNIIVTIGASDISDIASAVVAALPITSQVSDIYSLLSDLNSEFLSRVPKRVATDSQLSDLASDIKSAVAGVTVTIDASAASDIASAVWAHTVGARVDSRVLVNQSRVSDIYSLLSDVQSDFQSRVPKRVATDSQLSDLHSDLRSFAAANQSTVSDIYSLLSDVQSDFQSRVPKAVATNSQLSDLMSDLRSLVEAGVPIDASTLSDIRSAITATPTETLDLTDGIETGVTLRQALRLILAASAGKLSGAATTTITIRNAVADSKDRIVATVTADGDRTAITTDLT